MPLEGGRPLKRNPKDHIAEALRLVHDLLVVSEEGEADAEDDGCRLLYGIMRDYAHRIRSMAETERDAHQRARFPVRPDVPR